MAAAINVAGMLGVLKRKSPSASVCAFADGDFFVYINILREEFAHAIGKFHGGYVAVHDFSCGINE